MSRNYKQNLSNIKENNFNFGGETQEIQKRGITFENPFRFRNSVELDIKKKKTINLNSLRHNLNKEQNLPNFDFDNITSPNKNNEIPLKITNYHLPKISKRISSDKNNDIVKLKNLNKTSGYFEMKGGISFNNTFGVNNKFHKIKIVDIQKIKEKIKNKEIENELKRKKNITENKTEINFNSKKNINSKQNDSFIDELTNLLINVNMNKNLEEENKQNEDNNGKSIDNDKEIDPRINFEKINKLNQSRPQTSYGGLNTRRKNLENALQNSKYKTKTNFFIES